MDVKVAAATLLVAVSYFNFLNVYYKKNGQRPRKRRCWMTAINRNRTKISMDTQLAELIHEPSGQSQIFSRMSSTDFEYLLSKILPIISKQNTQLREAIPAKVRLAITLRFLASGESYQSLHVLFKMSTSIISRIIPEVCEALNRVLKDEVKIPSSAEEWLKIEKGFNKKFPRCVGAIGARQIVLLRTPNTALENHNYKKIFNIVLLALVDSDHNFIFADIGSQGRNSDGDVFRDSLLWQQICSESLDLPAAHPLPGFGRDVPNVFLSDGAFSLSTSIMTPYPGKHNSGSAKHAFNQRLSKSCAVVENVFGVLATRFRVFKKPFVLDAEKTSLITMTCVLLHNFLRRSDSSSKIYTPSGTIDVCDDNGVLVVPGSWRGEIESACAIRSLQSVPRKPTLRATEIREEFASYFYNT